MSADIKIEKREPMELANTDSIQDKFLLIKEINAEIFKAIFKGKNGKAIGAVIIVGPEAAEEIVAAVEAVEKGWE
jgi:hypothetical protein